MDTIRQNKIGRLIQRDLSELFQNECKAFTEGAMVSITQVRVSSDLSYAKVYLSIFPQPKVEKAMQTIEASNGQIRFALGRKIGKQVRIIPELRFFIDDSFEYLEKIDDLLKK